MRFAPLLICILAAGVFMIASGKPVYSQPVGQLTTQTTQSGTGGIGVVDQPTGPQTVSNQTVTTQATNQSTIQQQITQQITTNAVSDDGGVTTNQTTQSTQSNQTTTQGSGGDIPINTFTIFCGGL